MMLFFLSLRPAECSTEIKYVISKEIRRKGGAVVHLCFNAILLLGGHTQNQACFVSIYGIYLG